jgi:ribonuclease HI
MNATAYADGSCLGNPGPGGWGVHVQFDDGRIVDLGGGEQRTTNNRMELRAAIEAARATRECEAVTIIVDSEYVKRGITGWVTGWKKKGWLTQTGAAVSNRELWEELDALADKRITWQWTRAHVGTLGNERVDSIARWFAEGMGRARQTAPPLRTNPRPAAARLPAPSENTRPAVQRSTARSAVPGTRYLSLIDGVAMRHRTWDECKERVNGLARARFRKAVSDAEERKIFQEWGVRPDDVVELEYEVRPRK